VPCHRPCNLGLEANLHKVDPLGRIEVSSLIALFLDLIDEVPDAGGLAYPSVEEQGSHLLSLLGIGELQPEFRFEGIPCCKVGQWLCECEEVELVLFPIVSVSFYVLESESDSLIVGHGVEDVVIVTLRQEGVGLVGFAIVFSRWCCFDSGQGSGQWALGVGVAWPVRGPSSRPHGSVPSLVVDEWCVDGLWPSWLPGVLGYLL